LLDEEGVEGEEGRWGRGCGHCSRGFVLKLGERTRVRRPGPRLFFLVSIFSRILRTCFAPVRWSETRSGFFLSFTLFRFVCARLGTLVY
jgi:hypothetical protein